MQSCSRVCQQSEGGSDVTSMYSPGRGGDRGRIVRSPCARYLSCHLSEQLNINFMLFYFCYYKLYGIPGNYVINLALFPVHAKLLMVLVFMTWI
jgi:hypothetical protein